VAAEAGAPAGLLTYYFGSIDGLLEAALASFVEREIARVREVLAALDTTSDADLRTAVAEGALAVFRMEGLAQVAQFELYVTAARREALRPTARACVDAYVELAGSVLARLGAARPQEGARALVALLDGLTLQRLVTGEPDGDAFDHEVAIPAVLALVGAYAPAPAV
jgi:DNA-binding transcriptional regulator YbjK